MSQLTKTVANEVKKFAIIMNQCGNLRAEQEMVDRELATIRQEISNPKISSYSRMINAYKLVIISILGYEVDSGLVEMITLLADPKFAHKQAGYLAFLMCYTNVPEACSLLINTMQQDLSNAKDEVICQTLSALAVIADTQISEALAPAVMKFAFGFSETIVKKKAFFVLKKMFKHFPNLLDLEPEFMKKIESILQKEYDQSVLHAVCSLLYDIIVYEKKEGNDLEKYKQYPVYLVSILKSLVTDPQKENMYCGISMPWFIVLLIKLIPMFNLEKREETQFHNLCEDYLQLGFSNSILGMSANQKNLVFAIQFEIMKYGFDSDCRKLEKMSISLMGKLLESNDNNVLFLTLDLLNVATQNGFKEETKKLFSKLFNLANNVDSALIKRVCDTFYLICDETTAEKTCELFSNKINSTDDDDFKEDLVFKLSILSEKYLSGSKYVNVMMNIALNGSAYISFEIWDRTMRKLSVDEEATQYCVLIIEKVLRKNIINEKFLELCCLVLQEYGNYCENIEFVAEMLVKKSKFISFNGRIRIVTCLMKMLKFSPMIGEQLNKMCEQNGNSTNSELQQRCMEAKYLIQHNEMIEVAIDSLTYKELEIEEAEVGEDDEMFEQQQQQIIEQPQIQTQQPVQQKQSSAALFDFLDSTPTQPMQPTQPQIPVKQLQCSFTHSMNPQGLKEKVEMIYKKMLVINEGVVFQDQCVQIGYRSKVIDNVVGVQLFYGNMTPQPLSIQVTTSTSNGMICSLQHDQIQVESKQQKNHVIQFKIISSFLDSPKLNMTYTINNMQVNVSLQLPITLFKFMKQSTALIGNEPSQTIKLSSPLNPQKLQALFNPLAIPFKQNNQIVESVVDIVSLQPVKIQFNIQTNEVTVSSSNIQLVADVAALISYAMN